VELDEVVAKMKEGGLEAQLPEGEDLQSLLQCLYKLQVTLQQLEAQYNEAASSTVSTEDEALVKMEHHEQQIKQIEGEMLELRAKEQQLQETLREYDSEDRYTLPQLMDLLRRLQRRVHLGGDA